MMREVAVLGLLFFLSACSLTPKPLSLNERFSEARTNLKDIFKEQPVQEYKLDYYQALARSVKYNLDYRIKLVNTALQAGQLDIAALTLFPSLNASGSLYTRNNDLNTSGITSDGVSTGLSTSTPRTLRNARVALSWNVLDFGMGYVRAQQQSERILIATEESRRQLQQLSQDVLVAYWSAYSAQELMTSTKQFQELLLQAKQRLDKAKHDRVVPKQNILNYEAALLEGNRRLLQLQYKYDKSISDLKHLLFLPVNQKIVLAPPPQSFLHSQDLSKINFYKLDAVTLVAHPQLRGQQYQQRIAKLGVRTVILQALPGINFNYGWNYTSNQFVQNAVWLDRSMDLAWNLLNLASLKTSYQTAELQVKYEKIKQMALTMAALTETRYSYSHYQTLRNEYLIAHQQTENYKGLYILNRDRKSASLASSQEVILAKLRTITSKMDEDLLLADLSVALGQLYLSVGADILPEDLINQPYPIVVKRLRENFILNSNENFAHFVNQYYNHFFRAPPPSYRQLVASNRNSSSMHSLTRERKTASQGHAWQAVTQNIFKNVQDTLVDAKKKITEKIDSLNQYLSHQPDHFSWMI